MPHAVGQFDVKLIPRTPQSDDEPTIGRLLLDKQYHGELSGPSKGDMLSNQTVSTGAAVYVAVERFGERFRDAAARSCSRMSAPRRAMRRS